MRRLLRLIALILLGPSTKPGCVHCSNLPPWRHCEGCGLRMCRPCMVDPELHQVSCDHADALRALAKTVVRRVRQEVN